MPNIRTCDPKIISSYTIKLLKEISNNGLPLRREKANSVVRFLV